MLSISFLLVSILQSLFWVVSFSFKTVVFDPTKLTSSADFKSTFQSSKASQSIVKMAYELSNNSNSPREIEARNTNIQTSFQFGSHQETNQTSVKRVIYYKFGYGSNCLSETTLTVGVMEGTCFRDVDLSFILHASGQCPFKMHNLFSLMILTQITFR